MVQGEPQAPLDLNTADSHTPDRPHMSEPPYIADRPHIVVLGAGVCGLYAARVLVAKGARVTVLDRNEVPGGLAAGRERQGNFYDFGVHQLHGNDRAIFEDIRDLMGERMISVEKQALIRYGNGFRRYPLEFFDLLTGIPPWTLAIAMTGLVVQQLTNRLRPHPPANAEEALIQLYGRPLYGFFFRDFTHRYWGIPPTELSAAFVRTKMPRLSAVDVIKKALGRVGMADAKEPAVESATKAETLYYSRDGAREMPVTLAEFIRRAGGEVHLESPVVGVDVVEAVAPRDSGGPADVRSGGPGDGPPNRNGSSAMSRVAPGLRVAAVRYQQGGHTFTLPCDAVLSTIPLPSLIQASGAAVPPEVQAAARQLRHKPVAVFGFLVNRTKVLDAQYVYYRNRIFHRLAEPANSGMFVRTPGHTVLLAEMTCEVGDDRWNGGEATRKEIVADLEREGVLAEADIVETHVFHDEFAYPVFALGFEPHLKAVEDYLARFGNLRSTGRQGGFCYPNMHGAMRMGADTAAALWASLPKMEDAGRPAARAEELPDELPDTAGAGATQVVGLPAAKS